MVPSLEYILQGSLYHFFKAYKSISSHIRYNFSGFHLAFFKKYFIVSYVEFHLVSVEVRLYTSKQHFITSAILLDRFSLFQRLVNFTKVVLLCYLYFHRGGITFFRSEIAF